VYRLRRSTLIEDLTPLLSELVGLTEPYSASFTASFEYRLGRLRLTIRSEPGTGFFLLHLERLTVDLETTRETFRIAHKDLLPVIKHAFGTSHVSNRKAS